MITETELIDKLQVASAQTGALVAMNEVLAWANKYRSVIPKQAAIELIEIALKHSSK